MITMNDIIVLNALSHINEHEYTLTTPHEVHSALLDTCADWYADLAEEYAFEHSVAYEEEAAFNKAQAALNALQSALRSSEAPTDVYTESGDLVPF